MQQTRVHIFLRLYRHCKNETRWQKTADLPEYDFEDIDYINDKANGIWWRKYDVIWIVIYEPAIGGVW